MDRSGSSVTLLTGARCDGCVRTERMAQFATPRARWLDERTYHVPSRPTIDRPAHPSQSLPLRCRCSVTMVRNSALAPFFVWDHVALAWGEGTPTAVTLMQCTVHKQIFNVTFTVAIKNCRACITPTVNSMVSSSGAGLTLDIKNKKMKRVN